jgi:hypothetical protein
MWPTVRRAIGFVVGLQTERGGSLNRLVMAPPTRRCLPAARAPAGLALCLSPAAWAGEPQPEWELAAGALAPSLAAHPRRSREDRFSMDWYYPILGGAVRGAAASARLRER